MDGSKLQAFRHPVGSAGGASEKVAGEAGRLVMGRDGKDVRVVTGQGLLSAILHPRQNQASRQAFFNALAETYGEVTARQVFNAHERASAAPLTPQMARHAMEDASIRQRVVTLLEGRLAAEVPSRAALVSASDRARASLAGKPEAPAEGGHHGPVLDTKHAPAPHRVVSLSTDDIGEHAQAKFLARVGAEAGKGATIPQVTAGDLAAANLARQGDAARALAAYEQSGALEVDRAAQAILGGAREGRVGDMAIERAVTRAMAQMKTPNAARSAIYQDFLRNGLLVMAARVMKSDTREGCPLLTQLAGRMAEDMDGIVGRAIAGQTRFLGKSHDEVVRQLALNPQRTFTGLPRLLTGLDTQMVTFQRTIHDLLGRVEKDAVGIGNTLLSGRAPGALTGIQVTSSDPHHGGQRVMILTFEGAPDTPVVYKPRDCRIDAGIVGNARTGGVQQSAGALLNQALGVRGEIGTYSYLLGGKDGGDYAFIECIKHQDKLPEGRNDLEGVKTFFRGIGQFLALAFGFGITDVHQGNGMVSAGGQMMFTDLEIAFALAVLRDGQAPPSLVGTMMDKLLNSTQENDFVTPLEIDAAGLIRLPRDRAQTSPTRNFILFDGRPMGPRDAIHGEAIRAALREGFTEAIAAMARPQVNEGLVSLLETQFDGKAHARYHPVPTIMQLEALENYRLAADKAPDIAPGSLRFFGQIDGQAAAIMPADGEVRDDQQQAAWRSVEGFLRHDFQDGDVAYFTRVLGKPDQVLHHDRLGAQVVDDPGQHLKYDGLGRSRKLIESLRATGPLVETKARSVTPPQAEVGGSVGDRFAALPPTVRGAFDGFMNHVLGIKPAKGGAPA